jgi:hypothetical protein
MKDWYKLKPKLFKKQRQMRANFPEAMALRVHRALSWLDRAEQCEDDADGRFIFLWFAFNAVYADETEFQQIAPSERTSFKDFFGKLDAVDSERQIYHAVWQQFTGPARLLMENKFVFNAFWQHLNGIPGHDDWQEKFVSSSKSFAQSFSAGDTPRVLIHVFDRLYVLRNQLIHGGATWNSAVNRRQTREGAAILAFLIPVFVDLMMDHPERDWGKLFYPVVS